MLNKSESIYPFTGLNRYCNKKVSEKNQKMSLFLQADSNLSKIKKKTGYFKYAIIIALFH